MGSTNQSYDTFNIPHTSVTVCSSSSSSSCVTISNVLVDTGSSGLRLMYSALHSAGFSAATTNSYECLDFADGYTWGPVTTAYVKLGGETTTSAIPIQIIDDSSNGSSGYTQAPSDCINSGQSTTSLNSPDEFDSNGVLGVGVYGSDCGTVCTQSGNTGNGAIYFTCPSGSCSYATLASTSDEVSNPVASFATDNNGVVLDMTGNNVTTAGLASATGTLTFGIGTETNNALSSSATVLSVNYRDEFNTVITSSGYSSYGTLAGFIDSGSNGYYFPSSTLSQCSTNTSSAYSYFWCSSATINTTNTANSGTNSATASIVIADLMTTISASSFAVNDVGGPASNISPTDGTGNYAFFDYGLPFFYSHVVYTAIEGTTVGGTYGSVAF